MCKQNNKNIDPMKFIGQQIKVTSIKDRLFDNFPYNTYEEFVDYYTNLYLNYTNKDLKEFAKNRMKIYDQQIYFRGKHIKSDSIEEKKNINQLNDIINDSIKYNKSIYLDLFDDYIIASLELLVLKSLPNYYTYEINYLWTGHEDLLYYYYTSNNKLYQKIIIEAYDIKRYNWFLDNGFLDSNTYKLTLKVMELYNNNAELFGIKPNRNKLIEETLNLKMSILLNKNFMGNEFNLLDSSSNELIISIGNKLQYKLENVENKINILIEENKNLEEESNTLKKYIQKMVKGKEEAEIDFDEITSLVNSSVFTDIKTDKVQEKIAILYEDLYSKIKYISPYLSDYSVNDLNSSAALLLLINKKDSVNSIDFSDLAIFPLTRLIEREFNRCILDPYKSSKFHTDDPTLNKKLLTREEFINTKSTQKCLSSKATATIGNIEYLTKILKNNNCVKASRMFTGFNKYLGNYKDEFLKLCDLIYSYELNISGLNIREIRNGISHGNDDITELITDKDVYEIFERLIYPPIEILNKIIMIKNYLIEL